MIIVDTNVVSEPFRPQPSRTVLEWLDKQNADELCLTTISMAEIYRGIAILPDGKKKRTLTTETDTFLEGIFENRIFAFDREAALKLGTLVSFSRRNGVTIGFADAQIAAIASVKNATVATRDVAPFQAAGVKVINPWIPN